MGQAGRSRGSDNLSDRHASEAANARNTYANVGYNPAAGHIAQYLYTVHEWNTRTTYIPRVDYWQKNFWHGAGANFWTIDGVFAPSYSNWTGYIRDLAGHADVRTTMKYVTVTGQRRADAIAHGFDNGRAALASGH